MALLAVSIDTSSYRRLPEVFNRSTARAVTLNFAVNTTASREMVYVWWGPFCFWLHSKIKTDCCGSTLKVQLNTCFLSQSKTGSTWFEYVVTVSAWLSYTYSHSIAENSPCFTVLRLRNDFCGSTTKRCHWSLIEPKLTQAGKDYKQKVV